MSHYPWAANEAKLKRALVAVGAGADEETVRAAYVKMGGLVITKNIQMEPVQEDKIVEAGQEAPEAAIVEGGIGTAQGTPATEPAAPAIGIESPNPEATI